MRQVWLFAAVPVLALGAFGWASAPAKNQTSVNYRCELGRHILAFDRGQVLSLIVRGRSYDLTWQQGDLARGQGLEWRKGAFGATLVRTSSGYALASRCVQR